jgi:hypothetical protein
VVRRPELVVHRPVVVLVVSLLALVEQSFVWSLGLTCTESDCLRLCPRQLLPSSVVSVCRLRICLPIEEVRFHHLCPRCRYYFSLCLVLEEEPVRWEEGGVVRRPVKVSWPCLVLEVLP